jgi:hypothetical protein
MSYGNRSRPKSSGFAQLALRSLAGPDHASSPAPSEASRVNVVELILSPLPNTPTLQMMNESKNCPDPHKLNFEGAASLPSSQYDTGLI